MLGSVSCASWPSVCLLWRNICLSLLPIFWLGCLLFDIELYKLYILEINPLSVALLSTFYLILSIGFLCCLWFPLLCETFNFTLVSFVNFSFISITLGHRSKKILLQFMLKSVLPLSSSRIFIVSGLTFNYLIDLSLFLYSIRECFNFILLHVVVQFSWHHLLKWLCFLHCIFLLLL